jgi:amino acid transporter
MGEKKGISFLTIISTVICVVFVCEAAAPAAAIGNQQFFWWIFLIVTFLIPYGLAVAELGTTYDSDGGIIDWIRDGLGDKWAGACVVLLLGELPVLDRVARHHVPAHP